VDKWSQRRRLIKHISSAAIENHLQTSVVYGGQMRKNNITVEEIRKKQDRSQILIECRNYLIQILPILRQINLQIISMRIQEHQSLTTIEKNSGDGINPCGTPDDK
jgi:hypothetical protein